MTQETQGEITRLLKRIADGEHEAKNDLVEIVYSDLHRMAHRMMLGERVDNILQPSALINEAFIRLDSGGVFDKGADRRYFFLPLRERCGEFLST